MVKGFNTPGCEPGTRGFESHHSPQKIGKTRINLRVFFLGRMIKDSITFVRINRKSSISDGREVLLTKKQLKYKRCVSYVSKKGMRLKKIILALVLLVIGTAFIIWSLNLIVSIDSSGSDLTDIAGKWFPILGLVAGLTSGV